MATTIFQHELFTQKFTHTHTHTSARIHVTSRVHIANIILCAPSCTLRDPTGSALSTGGGPLVVKCMSSRPGDCRARERESERASERVVRVRPVDRAHKVRSRLASCTLKTWIVSKDEHIYTHSYTYIHGYHGAQHLTPTATGDMRACATESDREITTPCLDWLSTKAETTWSRNYRGTDAR